MTSFAGQVLHVFRKDVMRARYLLLAYGALVALTTYGSMHSPADTPRALGDFTISSGWFVVLPIVLVVVGMLVAAFAVQEDSVARADAFWLSLPLRGSAIVGAKFLFGVLLLVPAVIGQALAFAALMPSFAGSDLLPSAWYYGATLLVSVLLAARTRDLKTFAMTVVFFAVASNVVASIVYANAARLSAMAHTSSMVAMAVGFGVGVAGLLWQYSRQHHALAGWLFSLTGAALLFLASKGVDDSVLAGREYGSGATPVERAPRTTLTMQSDGPDAGSGAGGVAIRLIPSSLTPGTRLDIRLERVEILTATDSVRPHLSSVTMLLGESEFPLAAGMRWLFSGTASSDSGRLVLSMDPRARALPEGSVRTVVVEGRAHEEERRPIGSMAARIGERVEMRDGRIEVSDVHVADSLVIVLTTTAATFSSRGSRVSTGTRFSSSSRSRFPLSTTGVMYALVNDGRREAIRLSQNTHGASSEMLVLPGAMVGRSYSRLTPVFPPTSLAAAGVDAAWLRSARLVIVEWFERTSYPVMIRAPLP